MEERDYFLAFGLPAPEEVGEEEQEPAEPVEEEEDKGEEAQEVAEPADDEEEIEEPTERTQSPEEDAKYAAARRKAEEEAEARIAEIQRQAEEAIAAEKARADALEKANSEKEAAKRQAEADKLYADRNMTNPYRNDSPIKTEAEYKQFLEDEAEAQAAEGNFAPMLKLLREMKNQVQPQIDVDKIIQEAFEKGKNEGKSEAQRNADIERRVAKDIDEIKKQDPDLELTGDIQKDWEAVLARPYGQEVQKHLKPGVTLLDAFKIGAQDFLIQREKEKALAAAQRKKAGTSHMKAPMGRGNSKEYPMDDKTKAYYKAFFPGMSEKELQNMHNKQMERREKGG